MAAKIRFSVAVTADRDERQRRWTVGELLTWTTEKLSELGIPEARVDAEHLLAHALGCRRMDLYIRHAELLDSDARASFRDLVRRRLKREPVAYIEGVRGFHALGLDLQVDARVLIPRPETEHLVDWLLEELPGAPVPKGMAHDDAEPDDSSAMAADGDAQPWRVELFDDQEIYVERQTSQPQHEDSPTREPDTASDAEHAEHAEYSREVGPVYVLDVGTGSGAIALAVKHARPELYVHAVDRSEQALEVARANAERCSLAIEFSPSFLMRDVQAPDGGWSAIAANLPYIPTADLATLDPEVRDHEPKLALDGGEDGLDLVRCLIDECRPDRSMADGGCIYLEVGIGQTETVAQLLRDARWSDVEVRPDLAGIPRVVRARWSS